MNVFLGLPTWSEPSIRRKVLWPLTLASLIMACVGVLAVHHLAWSQLISQMTVRTQVTAHTLARMTETCQHDRDIQQLMNVVESEPELTNIAVVRLKPKLTVLAANWTEWVGKDPYQLSGLAAARGFREVAASGREVHAYHAPSHQMYTLVPVALLNSRGQTSPGMVVVQVDTRRAEASLRGWVWRVGTALVGSILVLQLIATTLLQRHVIEPVESIASAAAQRSEGATNDYAIVETDDEIGRLAMTLNRSYELAYAARQEADRLAMVVRCTNNAVAITDPFRRIVWVNEAFTRMTGYQLSEAFGKSPGSLVQYEKTDAKTVAKIRDALKNQQPVQCEIRNRSKDGREYWLDLEIQPILDDRGTLLGFMSIQCDITDRVVLSQQLQSAQDSLTTATLCSNTGLWDWNPQTDEAWFSSSWFTMLGYTPPTGPSKGTIWRELLHPDDASRVYASLQAHLTGEADLYDEEMRMVAANGTWRWIRSVGQVVERDEKGHAIRVAGVHMDIHQRRMAEESLARREADYASLLSNLDGAVYRCRADEAGTMLFVSDRIEQLTGFSPRHFTDDLDEGYGRCTHRSIIHPDDLPIVERALAKACETAGNWSLEYRIVHRDGRLTWVYDRGTAFRNDQGQVTHLEGFLVNVTDKKVAQEELLRTQRRLRALIEGTDVVVWEFDPIAGQFTYVSPQIQRFGFGAEKWLELGFWDTRIHAEDQALVSSMRMSQATRGGSHRMQYRMIAADERVVWVEDVVCVEHDLSGHPILRGVLIDITAQRKVIDELRDARRLAESASQAKSDFLANMSHEIRTPMTAILGFADLLLEDDPAHDSPERRAEVVRTIKGNGEHLLAIINDILDLSKIEAGKMTVESIETDAVLLTHEALQLMKGRASGKNLYMRVDCQDGVPALIQSDPIRLRQILVNLIGNAIKFTEAGGVTVRLSVDEKHAGASQLRIAVCDTGIGMTAEQMGFLFQAFRQGDTSTTRRFGGTGLGLLISKRLAEMLGGDIRVTSEVGVGSCFEVTVRTGDLNGVTRITSNTVDLPSKEAVATVQTTALTNNRPLVGFRILLAEDGPDNQRLISFVLRKAGAEVTIVDNGAAAVELILADRDHPEDAFKHGLLLLDMQMPIMDGYTAARALREKESSIPIVAITAHAMKGDRERCLEAGCNDYATKPIDRAKLLQLVQDLYKHPSNTPPLAVGPPCRGGLEVPEVYQAATNYIIGGSP